MERKYAAAGPLRFIGKTILREVGSAKAKPAHFVFREFLRHAAILSLVLVLSELLIPLQFTFQSPLRRVLFIAWWAAFMAGWKWWTVRRATRRR